MVFVCYIVVVKGQLPIDTRGGIDSLLHSLSSIPLRTFLQFRV